MKNPIRFFLILLLLITVAACIAWRDAEYLLNQPLPIAAKQPIEIELGENLSALLVRMTGNKLLAPARLPLYLKWYARATGKAPLIKAGEYELSPGMSSLDLLNLIISGKTVLHELRLIEGWNFQQIMAAVNNNEGLIHTLKEADSATIMAAIGRPAVHPEGRFFPDTYRFPKRTTDEAFLRRAYAAMENVMNLEWSQRATDLPYASSDEALIMASIIEKETGAATERPLIAGVFVRRLRLDMKLQTDPTVIYGIGDNFDGNLTREDLNSDTPYNSYTRKGLPPTPICIPGRAAIHATLHPADGKALFFVARKDGTHQFSDTLQQHNHAVRQFQLKKRK